MDDFQKRFPRTVAMVESRMAAQNTMESARHIHQQEHWKVLQGMCDNRAIVGATCAVPKESRPTVRRVRPFNKQRDAIAVLDKFESVYNLSADGKMTVDLIRQFARQMEVGTR